MAKKQTIVDKLMAETIIYGGVPLSRATVAQIMHEDGWSYRDIDLSVFTRKAHDCEALTYAEFRQIEAAAHG